MSVHLSVRLSVMILYCVKNGCHSNILRNNFCNVTKFRRDYP